MGDDNQSGWNKFWEAISFDRLFKLVGLFLLGALVIGVWSSGIKGVVTEFASWFDHAGEVNFARGLITFMIVAATVTMAVVLVIYGLYSRGHEKDPEFWKIRFSMSKEVMTAFMGILGTIMGFYYAEDRVSTAKISTLNETVRQSPIGELEKEGFVSLLAKDFDNAAKAFADAYKLNPTYHNVGEISKLLGDRADRFRAAKDPKQADAVWAEVFCEISESKFTLGMSDEMTAQVRKNCPTYTPGGSPPQGNVTGAPASTPMAANANLSANANR